MADFKLDTATGDLDLSTGDIEIVRGDAAILQQLDIRFNFFLGEWFLDQRIGIPYFQKILGKGQNLEVIRGIYRQTAVSCPGIASLDSFSLSVDKKTRTLRITLSAKKITGGPPLTYDKEFIL